MKNSPAGARSKPNRKRGAAPKVRSSAVTLINASSTRLPKLSARELKQEILGNFYELSVIFVKPPKSRELNRIYRKKDKPTNILSFPLTKKIGELYLCPGVIKKELKLFERSYKDHLTALLIHGMFHLKGLTHGSTMEAKERQVRKKFDIE